MCNNFKRLEGIYVSIISAKKLLVTNPIDHSIDDLKVDASHFSIVNSKLNNFFNFHPIHTRLE
jgi:hypothetical protein